MMRFVPPDPKHEAVLNAAWDAVCAYGYRKTSMDDIAKGAGMSRPALYVHFKNKEAICRSLVARYFYNAICDVHEELSSDAAVPERLRCAFQAQGGGMMESVLGSAHGNELLEAGNATSADIVADGEAELRGVYARWLQAESDAGAIVLPVDATQIAALILTTLHGVKSRSQDYSDYKDKIEVVAKMMAAALKA